MGGQNKMIKKIPVKRLMAMLLTFVMLLTMIPVGVYYTVFAADTNCIAVEVQGKKVYFYGAKTLDVSDNSVTYTSDASDTPKVYIDGLESTEITESYVEFAGDTITFSNDWLNAQDKWIAVNFDSTITVPTSEPSVDVDTSAPTMTESNVSGNPIDWVKDKATLTVSASDGDGVGVVAYSSDNVNWQETDSFELTENGDYTFYAKDAVGNVSNGVTVSVTKIDNIAPTISSVEIDPNTWTNEDVRLIVTANDDQSGLATEAYKIDDGPWQTSNEFTVNDSASHTFTVRDAVGHEQITTATADKHDIVKPEVLGVEIKWGIFTIGENDYTSPYVAYDFYISGYDDKSGVAEYSKDGINWQASNKFTMKGAGTYTFYVKDNAGNISEAFDYSLKGDITAPTIESITPNTTEPTNKEITIIISASDNDGGADLHDKAYAIDSQSNWQKSNSFKIKDSNEHTIYVRDNAKPENVAQQTFTAENFCDKKPTIENITLSTTNWTKEDVTLSVIANGTKNNAGREFPIAGYKMDDGEWQTSNEFVISDCLEHSFIVKDTAGNESLITKKAVTNYDNNHPMLADGIAVSFSQDNSSVLSSILNKLTFGRFFNEKLVITVNAKDIATETSNVSGIEKAIFKFVNEKDEEYTFAAEEIGNDDENLISFVVEAGDLPADFEGNAKIVLTDAAGNENTIDITTGNSDMGDIPEDSDFYFMIENTAPNVDSITPSQTPVDKVYKNDYSVEFKVSDNYTDVKNSGLARVQIKVNGTVVLDEDYQNDLSKKPTNTLVISTKADETKVNNVTVDNWNKGKLKYEITVVDNAGNQKTDEETYQFDQTAPQITGFEFSKADKGYYKDESKFDEIYEAVSVEDYGFYFKNTVTVKVSAEDIKNDNEAIATGLKSITIYLKDIDGTIYLVKNNGTEIVKSNNNSISEAVAITTADSVSFIIPKDFKGQIFAFATDNVDNYPSNCRFILDNDVNDDGFVRPDGSIVETEEKHETTSAIEFTTVPTAQGTQNNTSNYSYQGEAQKDETMDFDTSKNVPLYNNDISFGVKVTDTYSGIREVSYTIIEGKESTTKTVAVDNEGKISDAAEGWTVTKTDSNLATEMTNTIAVSGNYNDMVLLIELTDRAGNKSYDYYVFGIDKTAPSITVTYDNNSSDTQSGTGDYFKANRTATILVQERNFNTENVKFTLKNAEGKTPEIVDKGLVTKDTDGNGDGNVYKYVISYTAEGVYTFDVNYTDRATNKASIDYKDSVAPKAFTLDKTLPTISVSYDNNDAQNEKYFKAYRTATITVVEHNFDVNRVIITQTSALSGNAIANPSVSWVNSGDTHTATIHYNADGDYTFDITMTDKADNKETSVNYGSSVAAKDFTVDTTYSDLVKVDGIADKGVLGLANGEINEDAKINITINDVNLDNYNIKLTRSRVLVTGESDGKLDASQDNVVDNPETQCAEDNVDVTSKFVSNASGTENATVVISIPKKDDEGVKNDGLYTLTIEAKDKAGNAYDTNANIITFSVNRFGSVFTFSKDLYDLINKNDGYTKSVSSTNLTVYEYNATSVNSESVEVISNNDSKALIANADYTVGKDTKQTDTSWSKYTYTIRPDNFKNDGVYTLRISSKDDASITSQTVDYDVCSATFRVDSTPADIISVNYSTEVNKIAGHDGGSAKADNLTVNFTVEDLIRLETVEVFVNDMENPVKTYVYGKDFDDANSFDGGSFELSNDTQEQSFKIVATDKAGNIIDTSEGDSNGNKFEPGYVFFDHITVTTNQIVIWAKSPVFWVVIGGVVAAAVGLTIFAVVKKRKKNDE